MRKRFRIKPFTNFTLLKPVNDFSKIVAAEAKAIFRLQSEFKDAGLILRQWLEKLDWLEAIYSFMPNEEIIFSYHTPWLWKFNLDLYFPGRQLAIVFHTPDEYCSDAFVDGQAGKIQLTKEWERVLKKAERNYGIRVVHASIDLDKSCISKILDGFKLDGRVN